MLIDPDFWIDASPVNGGTSVVQAMKRSVKDYLERWKALVSGHVEGQLAGSAGTTCPSQALHNALGLWYGVRHLGGREENQEGKSAF
jgi:hypothetical protein